MPLTILSDSLFSVLTVSQYLEKLRNTQLTPVTSPVQPRRIPNFDESLLQEQSGPDQLNYTTEVDVRDQWYHKDCITD